MASERIQAQRRSREEREASGYKGKTTGSGPGDNFGGRTGRWILCVSWAREPGPGGRRALSVKGTGQREAWSKVEVRGKKRTFRFTVSHTSRSLHALSSTDLLMREWTFVKHVSGPKSAPLHLRSYLILIQKKLSP